MTKIKALFYLLFCFSIFGCSSKEPYLPTVTQVNLDKYTGTWYEIARFEHSFQKGCKNVTATYKKKEDGDIKVINKCTIIGTGEKKKVEGTAYSVNESNSKLKVSFFWPFFGDYYIIDLADTYNYAVVGTPSREYLWILSRTKTIDEKLKKHILQKVRTLGFDTKNFIWTIQE